jgi:hypothetical protein
MPRGRKPKTTTETVPFMEQADYVKLTKQFEQEQQIQTEVLYKDLAKLKDLVSSALRHVGFIDECDNLAEAAFKAGRAYGPLDEVNDKLESMLESLYENGDFNFDHWEDIND